MGREYRKRERNALAKRDGVKWKSGGGWKRNGMRARREGGREECSSTGKDSMRSGSGARGGGDGVEEERGGSGSVTRERDADEESS